MTYIYSPELPELSLSCTQDERHNYVLQHKHNYVVSPLMVLPRSAYGVRRAAFAQKRHKTIHRRQQTARMLCCVFVFAARNIMDIIDRHSARTQGLTYYFTGKPCGKGHVSPRYVSTANCSACLTASGRAPKRRGAMTNEGERELTSIGLRVYHSDWPAVRDTALALCRARYPDGSFREPPPPKDRTVETGFYHVAVPPDSVQMMHDLARNLLASHRVDVAAERARILGTVLNLAGS